MKRTFYPGISLLLLLCFFSARLQAQTHRFTLADTSFLLDGKPFQVISGEMHPARIPKAYWRQRIQMARAMGCNTIAAYVFWNYIETTPGEFDFRSENRDIAAFIRLCKEEGMWVLLRPGPYVCAEWDFGGLPAYLLRTPGIRLRCLDSTYMHAVTRYVTHLSQEVKPLLCTNGGPILMVQVENEYGSFANDKNYLEALRQLWVKNGINVPFYTADGATDYMLEAGNVDGAAIGLDSGGSDDDFAAARRRNPHVPSFSSETYPGWLTHWGEKWAKTDSGSIVKELQYLLSHHKSFNLYVVHGGTNFGYWAGANAGNATQYQPDVTSYDYDAPINEQGQATPKYYAIRRLIQQYTPHALPEVPAAIPTITIPSITMEAYNSIWNLLPKPVLSPEPLTMEALKQDAGMVLYRTKLIGHKSGNLVITEPHDFALVFVDGKLIDTVYRDGGKWSVKLPKTTSKEPVLDILVEAMGHINFAQFLTDRKGITDRVTLNGMTLMNWEQYPLPLTEPQVAQLPAGADTAHRSGLFFKGSFTLAKTGDTYIDLSHYRKGNVWVNGHNLGRFWNRGPQLHLYCPAGWLKQGNNNIVIFDLLQTTPQPVQGVNAL